MFYLKNRQETFYLFVVTSSSFMIFLVYIEIIKSH